MRTDLPTAKSLARHAKEHTSRVIFQKCQEAANNGQFSITFTGKVDKTTLNLIREQGISIEINGAKHTLCWN